MIFFSLNGCYIKVNDHSQPYYLLIAEGRIVEVLTLCKMQTAWAWIWISVAVSIFYEENHYTTSASWTYIHTYIYIEVPWYNGYRRRKWTRWPVFTSWMMLIAFHIALTLLGKIWIQSFSLQLWVDSRGRLGSLVLVWQPVQEKEISEFKLVEIHLKIDLLPHAALSEWLVHTYIHTYISATPIRINSLIDMLALSRIWFGLLSLLNGISTDLGYLMS